MHSLRQRTYRGLNGKVYILDDDVVFNARGQMRLRTPDPHAAMDVNRRRLTPSELKELEKFKEEQDVKRERRLGTHDVENHDETESEVAAC